MEGAGSLLWLALFAVAFWLLLVRPQRRRQRQLVDVQHSVQPGDEVMLSAGMFARVIGELDDPAAGDCLLVEVSPGVEIKIARGSVMRVVHPPMEDTGIESDTSTGAEPPAETQSETQSETQAETDTHPGDESRGS